MTQLVVRNTLLAAALAASVAGCQMYERHRPTFWPFPERKLTTYNTPAMRGDAIKQLAEKADGKDTPQQREITDQLARQIQVEPDPLVRQAVISAMEDFRTPMAQQVLQAGLNDDNEAVRVECCQVLGRRAEAASVASLAVTLRDDKNDDVKMAAAKALGKIKSPEAMKALAVALDDRDPAMQYVGVQSLKSITGKDYGPDVQTWRQVAAGGAPPAAPASSIAERMRDMSPFK